MIKKAVWTILFLTLSNHSLGASSDDFFSNTTSVDRLSTGADGSCPGCPGFNPERVIGHARTDPDGTGPIRIETEHDALTSEQINPIATVDNDGVSVRFGDSRMIPFPPVRAISSSPDSSMTLRRSGRSAVCRGRRADLITIKVSSLTILHRFRHDRQRHRRGLSCRRSGRSLSCKWAELPVGRGAAATRPHGRVDAIGDLA